MFPTTGHVVQAAVDGVGVDAIIEMLADVNLETDLTLLRKCGRVIVSEHQPYCWLY